MISCSLPYYYQKRSVLHIVLFLMNIEFQHNEVQV